MEKYKCVVVDLGYYKSQKNILININDETDEIEINTEVDGIKICSSDECYFIAYQKIRDELLSLGYGLQCNGSRINAIQSGMMRQCEKIYLVEMGHQAMSNQIVCIWDYADIDCFPNTEEQLEYAEKWYECEKI